MGQFLFPLLALLAGFAITLQAQFMGLLDKTLGTKESVLITYASGGALAVLLALVSGRVNLRGDISLPWYAYTTGALGLVIVGTIGYVVPRIGAARGLTMIVASQFLLAALVDQFGLLGAVPRPLDPSRILGLAIMLGGVWLVVR
ncbi:MAG TPA: DMT family transporter [Anaerolineales bacterium]|nr:DMT family transporter [Anaerolineales bacterium]